MLVTWTVLRTPRREAAVPWRPQGATCWRAGGCGPGRAEPPDPRWWSVLATRLDRPGAEAGPPADAEAAAWHVVLEPASSRGGAVLVGGARPFAGLPQAGGVEGAAAVVTLAQLGQDSAREREFFRRFLLLGRGVGQAPGHLAASIQAPDDGAVLTFSAWSALGAALDWADAAPQHAAAVERQRTHRLVEASGFLRCAVLSSRGALGDAADPLAGRSGRIVREPAPAST